MSKITIEQLAFPTTADLVDILNLYKKIPGRTCSAAAYLDYLNDTWPTLGMFIVRNGKGIIGYLHAERPHILEPAYGYLLYVSSNGKVPAEASLNALSMAEHWFGLFGAKKWKMNTTIRPKAWRRLYKNLKPSEYVILEKDITNG